MAASIIRKKLPPTPRRKIQPSPGKFMENGNNADSKCASGVCYNAALFKMNVSSAGRQSARQCL
jgi:hypothetical protein